MFNRALQVKMVKNEKQELTPEDKQVAFATVVGVISDSIENLTKKVIGGVVLYITLDTVRQVMVARATRR